MKVLVLARGERDWRDVVQWMRDFDAEVIETQSTKLAERILDKDPGIDVVIVSNDDTDDSGVRLLRTIKQDHRLNVLPVIVAGSGFSDERVRECLSLDADDIMMLPTSSKTLEAKLRKAEARGKKRILVVDDEEPIRAIISQFLIYERYIPITVGSAEEAVQILASQLVHAVVTDIVLPGMNGVELLDKIKSEYPELPVILITGYSGQYRPDHAISMGADGFFAKPFNNIELVYTLRYVLGKSRLPRGTVPERPPKTSGL